MYICMNNRSVVLVLDVPVVSCRNPNGTCDDEPWYAYPTSWQLACIFEFQPDLLAFAFKRSWKLRNMHEDQEIRTRPTTYEVYFQQGRQLNSNKASKAQIHLQSMSPVESNHSKQMTGPPPNNVHLSHSASLHGPPCS